MATLGRLVVDLLLKTGSFESDLGRASKATKRQMKDIENAANAAGKVLGTALVAGAVAAGVAIKSAIDAADELNDISKKIGIPTDVLSGLQYAAKLSGVATEQLQSGLVKLVKFQADASRGAKENVKVFDVLGIAIKDSSGKLRDTQAVFEDFANVFAGLEDGPEKTALALRVFGKSGAELIPLLNEGKAGIAGYTEELRKLGGIVTPATAAAADQFNDNLDALKQSVSGLALQVAADLLPDLIALTGEMKNSVTEGGTLSNTAHNVASAIRFIADACDTAVRGVQALTSYSIALYGTLERISSLNPGVAIAKLFGGNTSVNIGTALDQGNSSFDTPNAAPTARPRSGRRGGRGMGADSRFTPDLSALFSPTPKGGGGAKKHKADVDEVAEAYKRMNAQMAETIALFGNTTEVAKVRYDLEHTELSKLSAEKKQVLLDQAAELDGLKERQKVKEEAEKLAKEEAEQIEQHKKSVKDLLADIAFETSLIGLNNDEREKMIALRSLNGEATADEAAQIRSALDALQQSSKANDLLVSNLDEFRGTFSDTVTDVLTGAQSIGDAFKSLADQIVAQLARIVANQLTESIFGPMGGSGGGSAGGLLGSLFSAFIGGGSSGAPASSSILSGFNIKGYASGTSFAPGGMAMVGENGPELVQLPRGSRVYPTGKGPGGSYNITINPPAGMSRQSASQFAQEVGNKIAAVTARNN